MAGKIEKKKLAPELRFPEFSGDWEKKKLGSLGAFVSGVGFSESQQGGLKGIPFYKVSDMNLPGNEVEMQIANNYVSKKQIANQGYKVISGQSIIFAKVGAAIFLERKRIAKGFLIDNNMMAFTPESGLDFLKHQLDRVRLSKYAQVGALPSYNQSDLSIIKIWLPNLSEQQKIASFLSVVDERISKMEEKKKMLEKYKKGIMQKIFSQEIRFKAANGKDFPDWEEKKLGDVFQRVTRKNIDSNKNVLTISGRHGLVNQKDYFSKSVSAKDVTGYFLIERGEFAYNKSTSKGFPIGALKRLTSYERGVVSTLYICFRLISKENSGDFFEQYFESGGANKEISKITQEGARSHGLLNLSVTDFFNEVTVVVPSVKEQKKIADFLTAIDEKTKLAECEVEKAKEWKRGLIQIMFV